MKIPLLDLKREYLFLKKDIEKELKKCFSTHQWILGSSLSEFEKRVANFLKVKFAIGVASGTDALLLSLRALALKLKKREFFEKKDQIITTPLTFIATAEAIVRSGATPVFVDVKENTFNISPLEVKKAITKHTVGILPVHLYGLSCDMDDLIDIAKEHNLFIVEDSAQSFGAEFKKKRIGTLGDLGAFSFFPSKNLGGYGDGGLITTNNRKLAEYVAALRNHGQIRRYDAYFLGYNSRLDSIQSAILLAKLKYIDEFNRKRIEIAKMYNKKLQEIEEVKLPFIPPKDEFRHVFHLYTIRVPKKKRNALLDFLNKNGISARVYYPKLIPFMKAFKSICKVKEIKCALKLVKEIISLPIHPFLTEDEVSYVASKIKEFFTKKI